MRLDSQAAVVLLSGGQDSTTCLVWAKATFARVAAVTFDYGQRHRVELDCAATIARLAGVAHAVIPCDSFRALGGSTLTAASGGDRAAAIGTVRSDTALPDTFVPGRNLVFLTLAAAYGWQRGMGALVAGVCQTDYSGYPDCRADTMAALQQALRLGMDGEFTIHAPLMHLSKAQSVVLMRDLGGLPLLAHSHTCYQGSRPPCGTCPACVLRAKGFSEAGVADPLLAG